jgi:hypothetical protein
MIRVIGVAGVVSIATVVAPVTAAACLASTLATDVGVKRATVWSWRSIFSGLDCFESKWLFTASHQSKEAY